MILKLNIRNLNQTIFNNGIENTKLKNFSNVEYNKVQQLFDPYTIKYGKTSVAIIGLDNLSWVNRRADLKIYLSKDVDEDFIKYFMPMNIEKYINYVHENNVYSICACVSESYKLLLDILIDSCMNFIGSIPYSCVYDNKIESGILFEHYPNMRKNYSITIPKNESISLENSEKISNIDEILYLKNGYRAIPSKMLEVVDVDLNDWVKTHIEALQNREEFSIPLGEDKYIIQEGNGNYGISRAIQNFSYILIDNNFKYLGYCNILETSGRNARIDIGIIPKCQGLGLGSMLFEAFYNELFEKGYMSVTSYVFEFNDKSNKMHKKLAQYNGTRKYSYYINGKLCDMNIYTKTKSL